MAQRGSNILRFLTITMTQGSADAFIEGSADTGIVPEDGVALEIVRAEIAFSTVLEAVSADFDIIWTLSRDTKVAVAGYGDNDSLLYDGISGSLTTSGQLLIPLRHNYPDMSGVYLVENTVYGQLDSNATGLTLTARWRLWYREVAVSEIDILRILNNS